MREYLINFMNEFEYPTEAEEALLITYDHITRNEDSKNILFETVKMYENDCNLNSNEIMKRCKTISDISREHEFTVSLLVFILLSKHLKRLYEEKGLDETIWYNSMCDLKYKLLECKAVKNIWGSFVAEWFVGFFNMTRFALGRLQFEVCSFLQKEYVKDGKKLTDKSKVINVHIPRTLTPLDKESCDDAYEQAKIFFENKLDGAPMAFVCYSWLLFPDNIKILPEKSNIKRFVSEYDVVYYFCDKDGTRPDMWRLFDMDYTGNADDYPEDTSLRRIFKNHIKNGGRTGNGYGVFFA